MHILCAQAFEHAYQIDILVGGRCIMKFLSMIRTHRQSLLPKLLRENLLIW